MKSDSNLSLPLTDVRVVVGGGGQYGPFDEITTLSMAGGDCGRGRAL